MKIKWEISFLDEQRKAIEGVIGVVSDNINVLGATVRSSIQPSAICDIIFHIQDSRGFTSNYSYMMSYNIKPDRAKEFRIGEYIVKDIKSSYLRMMGITK